MYDACTMAITSIHVRFFWGALSADLEGSSPSYPYPTAYATLGADASVGGGIGVRRATLKLNRTAGVAPADDDALMHFDFLNITGGSPDDTWITSDYTTLEALLTTWWNAVKSRVPVWYQWDRVLWHRVGPGITPPNPAERILDLASPISASGATANPPQCACSITFRTGVRHSWGRTYLPWGEALVGGRVQTTGADAIANATRTLFAGAASADFHPVVVSTPLNSALGIDTVETDDVADIIRRRRWKHTTYRKLVTV